MGQSEKRRQRQSREKSSNGTRLVKMEAITGMSGG